MTCRGGVCATLMRLAKDIAEGRIKSQLADLPRLVQLEEDLPHPTGSVSDIRNLSEAAVSFGITRGIA